MAFALIANVAAKSANSNGFTTAGINTTGANLLVATVADANTLDSTVSDSNGNTWVKLTNRQIIQRCVLFYCINPGAVGAGHTFTLVGTATFGSLYVQAWSGVDIAAGFDKENGASAAGAASIATGSVTPANNDSLLVAGLNSDTTNTISINGGFTISDQLTTNGGVAVGGAMAYLVQTTAAAANPTWSWTGANNPNAAIAVFKAGAGGGGGARARLVGGKLVGGGLLIGGLGV